MNSENIMYQTEDGLTKIGGGGVEQVDCDMIFEEIWGLLEGKRWVNDKDYSDSWTIT